MYICIYTYTRIYIYIYICIYTEREGENPGFGDPALDQRFGGLGVSQAPGPCISQESRTGVRQDLLLYIMYTILV